MQDAHDNTVPSVDAPIDLERFLPYRLSVLSNTISQAISGAYARRYGLSTPEWRIIAVLGRFPMSSARQVAERTAMDKVAVSRAVARLRAAGLVKHQLAPQDRRRSMLALTARGQAVLAEVAPLTLAYEQRLLAILSASERRSLEQMLERLLRRAEEIGPLSESPASQVPSSVRTEYSSGKS